VSTRGFLIIFLFFLIVLKNKDCHMSIWHCFT